MKTDIIPLMKEWLHQRNEEDLQKTNKRKALDKLRKRKISREMLTIFIYLQTPKRSHSIAKIEQIRHHDLYHTPASIKQHLADVKVEVQQIKSDKQTMPILRVTTPHLLIPVTRCRYSKCKP
jgi:hypothetical protein